MGKRDIPKKLQKLADINERRARLEVALKARAVQDTQDDLEAITAEQLSYERALRDKDEGLDGASLQLLQMGRAVHRRQRDEVKAELQELQEELDQSEDTHRDTIAERHYKQKLYEHCRDVDRRDALGREQKASDDQTSSRHGRDS
jgi:flagellar biosynthesis chaperone FliJ